jgi:hypothetical protein
MAIASIQVYRRGGAARTESIDEPPPRIAAHDRGGDRW